MPRFVYITPFVLFVPALLAMLVGGAWTWVLPVFTFLIVPIVDQLHPGTTRNATPEEEASRLSDRFFDALLYAVVPAQWLLVAAFLWRMTVGGFATWEVVGAVGSMGIAAGVFGINVAHELGHRRKTSEQRMAKALLATALYMHFFVEHNRGHHRRVATPDDPASARRGQTVYGFWLRSVTGGWRSAWHLETDRLARADKPWWSWDNEVVRAVTLQGALLLAVGAFCGAWPLAAFVVAATGGFLLLETVNYLEHYGLSRQLTERGTYERVRPHHSWNSERPFGRILLFDLTRHSDHHAHATRPYQVLRHHDGAPELPAGYPAMILLALVPPLFDRALRAPLADWAQRHAPAQAVAAK